MKCQEVGFGQDMDNFICMLAHMFFRCLLVQHDRRSRHVPFSLRLQRLHKGNIVASNIRCFWKFTHVLPISKFMVLVICALVA